MIDPNAFYSGGIAVGSYDLFADSPVVAGDVAFYANCAQRFSSDVLELGAGTGRVAIPLVEAGHSVTGLDLSPAMLDVARSKATRLPPAAAERLTLVQGDMCDFDLGRRFALAMIPFRAFQHVIDPATQRRALTCVHRHLKPGGHLVINLFDPRLEFCLPGAPAMQEVRELLDPATGHRIRRTMLQRDNDPFRQLIQERMRLDVIDEAGRVVMTEEGSMALRWTLRQEMAYLFELCGFEVVDLVSDFFGAGPAYGREQIWIARAI
jgi:SAM-dependent methyltransferase